MNRQWAEPSSVFYPEVFATKKLAEMVIQDRKIDVFCDFHGHFQPLGSFMFCNSFDRGTGVPPSLFQQNANLRILPYLLTQINKYFKLKNSPF